MRWMPLRGIALKMTVLVLGATSIIFGIIISYSYYYSRNIILDEAQQHALNLTLSVARKIEQEFRSAAKIAQNLARFLSNAQWDEKTLNAVLKALVAENKEIYGSTVAFEPDAFRKGIRYYAPYFYKTKEGIKYDQLGSESYNYFQKDWYHIPKVLEAPVWSDPYFDEGGGNIAMTTYSFPLFENGVEVPERALRAIITVDVSLEWLADLVSSVSVGQTGFCFIISDTGTFVTYPDPKLVMRESIFSLAEELKNPKLRETGRAMLRQKSAFVDMGSSLTGEEAFLAFARIESPGWSLAAVFPKQELLAEITRLYRTNVLLALTGLGLLLLASLVVAGSITRPLRRMVKATEQVAHGDLDLDMSFVRSRDEVGRLADAFGRMAVDLKKHIRDVTEATAARERMESELLIAARIQKSMLPSVFPAFPERDEFDIYGVMLPAKEIGGDFYDFFFVDSDCLCVAIGDVSGKGVPAALFMATTISLLRSLAREGLQPEEILIRLNQELTRDNDACMFVTMFCCLIDLRNGDIVCANAGHDPPWLVAQRNEIISLGELNGPVVGLAEDVEYKCERVAMKPGDTLFAYTDGVTEALDANDQPFSAERLRSQLTGSESKTVRELIDGIFEVVSRFSEGVPQYDDTTMIAFRYNGSRR